MQAEQGAIDWTDFLGRPAALADSSLAASAVGQRSIFITGAGGSIGSTLARAALAGRPSKLVLLDLSESALYESYRKLGSMASFSTSEVIPVTGSVGDRRLLAYLFRQHRPQLVFHAAAYKHVPLMERNPFSAIANNAIGTYNLVAAALEAGVGRLVALSTDKAVNPHSIMGSSKRIAEQVALSHASEATAMNVVRLCNVLGTSGSVEPIFREQAEKGLPLTVTHAGAQRYFLAPAEAEAAILQAAASPMWGRLFIPDCGKARHIVDLARYISSRCKSCLGQDACVEFIGLRPGDKLREDLWSADELVEGELPGGMRIVLSPAPSAQEMDVAIRRLGEAVDNFDYPELMRIVTELVPGYAPYGMAKPTRAMLEAR